MAILELPYSQVFDLLHHSCTTISPDALFLMKEGRLEKQTQRLRLFLRQCSKMLSLLHS